MSCRERLINRNYQLYLSLCRSAVGFRDAQDLLHDMCEMVMSHDKFIAMCDRGELDRYIKGSIRICGHSATTRYHYTYRKHERDTDVYMDYMDATSTPSVAIDRTEDLMKLYDALEVMPWYEAEMLTTYYLEGHTAKTLSDVTGISKSSIAGTIRKAKEEARKTAQAQSNRAGRHDRTGDQSDRSGQGGEGGTG